MSTSAFLSNDWFTKALSVIAGAPLKKEYRQLKFDDGNDLVVKYLNTSNSEMSHYQRWRGTRLQSWGFAEEPSPDIIIKRSTELEYNCWLGGANTRDILENTQITVPAADTHGIHAGLTFPLSTEALYEVFRKTDKVKYADFVFKFKLTECPWGDSIDYYIQFESGIPTRSWLGDERHEEEYRMGLKCTFSEGLGILFSMCYFRDIGTHTEMLGDSLHFSDFMGLVGRPRVTKAVEGIENVAQTYLSFTSRIAALDFQSIREALAIAK